MANSSKSASFTSAGAVALNIIEPDGGLAAADESEAAVITWVPPVKLTKMGAEGLRRIQLCAEFAAKRIDDCGKIIGIREKDRAGC